MGQKREQRRQLNMQSDVIWLDGELLPFARANVHFLTPSLHYGMGVFAAMRCYETTRGPAVMRLEAHLKSFLRSIQALGFTDLIYDVKALREATHQTITANNFSECYVRLLMYLKGPMSLDMSDVEPAIGIACWEWDSLWGGDSAESGIRMMVSSYTRPQTITSGFPSKLTGNFVTPMAAKTLARKSGFDEAILLDPRGYVADCTGHDLFMVRGGTLVAPSESTHFGGVTREALMLLAKDAGIAVKEEQLSREQLYVADEVFVCGTAAEVVPVREIDHHVIGSGKMGPITRQLQKLYADTARGNGARSAEWLNYVHFQSLI